MAVDSGSVCEQKNSIKTRRKKVEPKMKATVTSSPGIRPVRGKVGDSGKGKTCHQCRHQNGEIDAAWCTNEINNKKCSSMYCYRCLMNRYGVKAEKAADFGNWKCPKCQGTCNCSICMKRRGQQPVGFCAKASSEKLVKTKKVQDPKSPGVLPVSEEPVKKRKVMGDPTSEKLVKRKKVQDPKSSGVLSVSEKPIKKRKVMGDPTSEKLVKRKKVQDSKSPGVLPVSEKPVKKRKIMGDPKASGGKRKVMGDPKVPGVSSISEKQIRRRKVVRDVVKTPKKELTSVAGIDVPLKDVGNALQFLEFCAVFGKILGLKKGEPEYVLQEILEGEAGGKVSATIQFQIHLLSLIQNDRGVVSAIRRSSWLNVLKECLSKSLSDLKVQGPNSIEDYERLDESDKLRLLNLVCDEVLSTQKLRSLFESFNVSDAKKKSVDATDEGRNSKQKPLAAQEGEDKGRKSKPKVKDGSGKGIIDGIKIPEALRVAPILVGRGGETYWKLNAFGKSDVLCQSIGKGDEKWSAIDDEGKGILEKHISSLP